MSGLSPAIGCSYPNDRSSLQTCRMANSHYSAEAAGGDSTRHRLFPTHCRPRVFPEDYDLIREDDRVSIRGLKDFAPGRPLKLVIRHSDGKQDECLLDHSFNEAQIAWFKAGSALNLIAKQQER